MTRTIFGKYERVGRVTGFLVVFAAAVLALSLLVLVGGMGPAGAAFPGKNGKIAYDRAFDSWTKNASLASQETKLLDDAQEPAYSPDGSRFAFERANEIYVANVNGTGTPIRLTNDCLLDSAPTWSHDGTRIAFVRRSSTTDPTSCSGGYNIWTMNADGTGKKQLTTEGGFASPSWSVPVPGAPDGKILYKGGGLDFWTMNPDGSGKVKLTYTCPTENGICDDAAGNPTFSPDGTEIAAEYFGDIFVIPSGGGESRVILGTKEDGYPGAQQDPAWSPDGTKIAFEHNDIGGSAQFGISWARADGRSTAPTQITGNTGEQNPDWQPIPQCTITGSGTIIGTLGKDVICGSAGNDTINGAGGNDIVLAQGGNDRITGALGNDTINGGPGVDTALYAGTTPVRANLSTEFASGVGLDVLLGIENLSGSSARDLFIGNGGRNALSGLGGNDVLDARDRISGNDRVDGGTGTADTCRRDAGDTALNCP